MRTLTPEAATKALTGGTHAISYTYAREIGASRPPYHLVCRVCGPLGWHRASLGTLTTLAHMHAAAVEASAPARALAWISNGD